jgi:YYY domain-containing protein
VAGTLDAAGRLLTHDGPLTAYDWFAPSRSIPDAITEFPMFSFLLGDLHAHVLAIPFTLLALGFALQVALRGPRRLELVPAGVALGVLYAINAWSFPVVAGVMALAPVLWLRDPGRVTSALRAVAWSGAVIVVALLALAPFWLAFEPNARGLGLVDERRGLARFARDQAGLLGAFAWVLAAAFAQRARAVRRRARALAFAAAAALAGGALLAPADLIGVGLLAIGTAVALWTALTRALAAERFGWLLIAAGLACVAGPEVVYVRDEFDGSPLERMNTIFKLGYQAWILLAIMAACVLPFGRRWLPAAAWRVWSPIALLLLAAAAAYPVAGTYARTGGLRGEPTLDGRRWLERDAPGDVAAIEWLRAHAGPDAVVLEAVGDDYSAFGHARISTFSGRSAVLGWEGHERQWGHDPGARRAEVALMYRAVDPALVTRLFDRYDVGYVVAGPLERADYGTDGLAKFDRMGTRVLDRDGTTVWRLQRTRSRRT